MIGCRDAVDRLWDFLDGGLADGDRRELEAHLAFCLRCCGELAFARELRAMLRERTSAPPPDDALMRLSEVIDGLGDPLEEDRDT